MQPKLVLPASFLLAHACIEVLSSKGAPTEVPESTPERAVVAGGSTGIMRLLADIFPTEMGHLYPPSDTALGQQVIGQ